MAAWLAALALAGCPSTTVHYGPTPVGTPWVASGAITGHLFAYGGRTLMDARVNASDGLVLYTRGGAGNPTTKILWTTRGASGQVLLLRGTRLDAAGSFSQRFRSAGTRQFPSIVRIPAAGCWRLSVRSGRRAATFVVNAVDAPAESWCEPTAVFRRSPPHPRFGEVVWMPTTPTGNGIVAVDFVSTLPNADRAVVLAGGVKFLWWSPKPGGELRLDGWRLDGLGTFGRSFQGASTEDRVPVFPSELNIPTAGCWAVRVGTGGRSGLAVFNSVVTG